MSRSKKILKVTAYVVGGFAGLIAIGAASVYGVSNHRLNRKYVLNTANVVVPSTPEAIERGRHVVTTRGCAECHGADFGGAKVIDDPMAGIFYGANITRGKGGLPADYSDIDYVRAIRHGLKRDGLPLALMPSAEYAHLSDEDLGAVIAYLKTLAPVDRARVPIQPGPIIRVMLALGKVRLAVDDIDHSAPPLASIEPGINPRYGKYLATSCIGCHGGNLSGGKIVGAPPDWPSAANLTPSPEGRLGQWTEEQFINALRTRRRPDGTELNAVMPSSFATMNDLELKALWSYIHSLPASPTGQRAAQ
jgi:mono/diheme cytochrome c family protein